MRGQKRLFIVDFDNTLIDTEGPKSSVLGKFPNRASYLKAYRAAKVPTGFFNPDLLPAKYRPYFWKIPFKRYLFPGAIENLKKLKKLGRVIIFSFGDKKFQEFKIAKSGVKKIVGQKNVIVVQNKSKGVGELMRSLGKDKYTSVTIIDDVASVLEKAYEVYPQVVSVWVRYGKYKNKQPILRTSVTFETPSFGGAVDFAQRFVSFVSPSKTHLKFTVLRDITETQIGDLVKYTGRDKKVSACTHDDGRFRSKKAFASWRARGKVIYTLTGRDGKLLGIVWFARKKYGKFNNTVAVRLYPPVRGKGLSFKFMKEAYGDFSLKHKGSLWLSVRSDNVPALKLYKKFGFVKSAEKGGEWIMTFPKRRGQA
ncbi:MAG TPA: GNAT family N-acetyltransferase [Patescibacteria group bacterium]|nr:GNAT family N-acetyltransferase [Patescibacteria group bacterium]